MSYSPCPFCGSTNVSRERSPDGKTKCGDCKSSLKSDHWDRIIEDKKKKIKGGNYPKEPVGNVVMEPTLVGCKQCQKTWYEDMPQMEGGTRINGPLMMYDFCSCCATEQQIEMLADVMSEEEEDGN